MPIRRDDVCSQGKIGSRRSFVKVTRLTLAGHFRFSPINRRSQSPAACLKGATTGLMHRSNDEAMSSFRQACGLQSPGVVISSRSFGPEPRGRAPERRLPCRGFKQGQLLCLAMSADRLSDRFRQSSQISISVPSSTTCLAGTPKKVAEPLALCCRNAKRVSRQTAMPTTSSLGMIFSRPT